MSRLAYPYLRPERGVVQSEPWRLIVDGADVDLPSSIDDWDYNLDLSLRQEVLVDGAAIREQSGLPADTQLALCVIWRSSGSGLFGRGFRAEISGNVPSELSAELKVRGVDAGGILDIDTQVVLAEAIDPSGFAPHRAGSILWNQRTTVRLQGDGSQFPIAVVDFGMGTLPEDAGWHLQVDGSLDAAAMGSVLLLVNSRNKTVTEAFANAGKPRTTDKLALSAVYADIARTMVEHALAREDFVDDAEFDDNTLGSMLLDVFRQIFGSSSVKDVRLRAQRDPSMIGTQVQGAVGVFGANG